MDFDKRHKRLLTLLFEDELDLKVEYVREDDGRVYFHFYGDYEGQAEGRISFDKKFATEVICDLCDAGYLELIEGRFRDLREIMAKLAGSGRQEFPELRITIKGEQLLKAWDSVVG